MIDTDLGAGGPPVLLTDNLCLLLCIAMKNTVFSSRQRIPKVVIAFWVAVSEAQMVTGTLASIPANIFMLGLGPLFTASIIVTFLYSFPQLFKVQRKPGREVGCSGSAHKPAQTGSEFEGSCKNCALACWCMDAALLCLHCNGHTPS